MKTSNHLLFNRNPSSNFYVPPTQQQVVTPVKKKWPEDDLPPPVISHNHYRHIHEQCDFTLENLSMAGETEQMEYDDYKIMPEYEWTLDLDV